MTLCAPCNCGLSTGECAGDVSETTLYDDCIAVHRWFEAPWNPLEKISVYFDCADQLCSVTETWPVSIKPRSIRHGERECNSIQHLFPEIRLTYDLLLAKLKECSRLETELSESSKTQSALCLMRTRCLQREDRNVASFMEAVEKCSEPLRKLERIIVDQKVAISILQSQCAEIQSDLIRRTGEDFHLQGTVEEKFSALTKWYTTRNLFRRERLHILEFEGDCNAGNGDAPFKLSFAVDYRTRKSSWSPSYTLRWSNKTPATMTLCLYANVKHQLPDRWETAEFFTRTYKFKPCALRHPGTHPGNQKTRLKRRAGPKMLPALVIEAEGRLEGKLEEQHLNDEESQSCAREPKPEAKGACYAGGIIEPLDAHEQEWKGPYTEATYHIREYSIPIEFFWFYCKPVTALTVYRAAMIRNDHFEMDRGFRLDDLHCYNYNSPYYWTDLPASHCVVLQDDEKCLRLQYFPKLGSGQHGRLFFGSDTTVKVQPSRPTVQETVSQDRSVKTATFIGYDERISNESDKSAVLMVAYDLPPPVDGILCTHPSPPPLSIAVQSSLDLVGNKSIPMPTPEKPIVFLRNVKTNELIKIIYLQPHEERALEKHLVWWADDILC